MSPERLLKFCPYLVVLQALQGKDGTGVVLVFIK